MVDKYMKTSSTPLAIKEMEVKMTLRLPSHKFWLWSREQITTNAGQDVGRRNHNTLLVGMEISVTTMEVSMEIPQKTANKTIMGIP
jgi:hypothetical protein